MKSNPFQLDDEVALITGGGSGLGLAIAESFVRSGARVALIGRREQVLREACSQLGCASSWYVHDVTDRQAGADLVARVENNIGPVSILVNNAGMHLKKAASETTSDEFDAILQIHLIGAHNLTRVVLPGMIQRQHGTILFTASMTTLIGMPQVVAYSAAKAAYGGMVRSLAAEVSPHGVRVNAIAPGWIDTPMLHQAIDSDAERTQKILSRTPMHRFGQPEDVGWAATYLCSPAAKFVTGILLPVDGGASIGF